MLVVSVAVRTELDEMEPVCSFDEPPVVVVEAKAPLPAVPLAEPQRSSPEAPTKPLFRHGWPVPSTISLQPDEARA